MCLGAQSSLVVEYQRAQITAEWLLQLGGMVGGWPGMGGDLGIARVLVNRCVSRGERCESDRCCGGGHSHWRDDSKSELLHFDAFYFLSVSAGSIFFLPV